MSQADDLGGVRGDVGKPKKSNRQPPWGHYAGEALPLGENLLLRRTIIPFRMSGPVWIPGDPKTNVRRALDAMIKARRDVALLEVVAAGPDAQRLAAGDRVLVRTSASLACPGCGRPADRRDPLDRRRRHRCRGCGTRWPREEGISLGGHGFNPRSDTDGPRFARESSYEVFMREDQVVAVLRGGEGLVLDDKVEVLPLGDRVLVRRVDEVAKVGSIELPEAHREKPVEGVVVAVGEGTRLEDGTVRPVGVAVGDRVLFGKFAGTEVEVGGVDHVIFREEDILARVVERPALSAVG